MHRLVLIASFLVAAQGKVVPTRLPLAGGKIVGGEDAEIEEVPYQVGIFLNDEFWCGSSILSETVVLTAAHCVTKDASSYQVFAGTNTIYNPNGNKGQIVGVDRVVIHPNYSFPNYDAAVLFLSSPLKFGPTAKPVTLSNQDQEIANDTPVVASGWGSLYEGGPYPKILQKVTVLIVDQELCEQLYGGTGRITAAMICAGLVNEGGKDTCQKDSGGPLVANDTLVGITSWGFGCAHPKFPGVSTRIAAISDWIKNKLLYSDI